MERDVGDRAVLVGYGEIGSKSRAVRTRMAERLRENVDAVLADRGIDADVDRSWARLVVGVRGDGAGGAAAQGTGGDGRRDEGGAGSGADAADGGDPAGAGDPVAAAARAAATAFGVVWARPSLVVDPTVEAVRDALVTVASGDAGTFAVRANRAGDHGFRSTDLEREGGAAVCGTGRSVDLDDPDHVYRVDCRADAAYVSGRQYDGPGGLPLGTQGLAVALVSGGIDSPVAAYETMRRGCTVLPVYVALGAYGGADHEARAVETARRLARYAPDRDCRLRVVDAGDVVADVVESVGATRMLSLRRAMLAAAAELAAEADAHSVVTGEVLGQKSSQTGPNLAVTEAAVSVPVHRPLLTWDKADVVERAREIGTFEDATVPVGCERVAPDHPETNADLAAVRAAEPPGLLERAREAARDARVVEWPSA